MEKAGWWTIHGAAVGAVVSACWQVAAHSELSVALRATNIFVVLLAWGVFLVLVEGVRAGRGS